jgi:hypothetical protein
MALTLRCGYWAALRLALRRQRLWVNRSTKAAL